MHMLRTHAIAKLGKSTSRTSYIRIRCSHTHRLYGFVLFFLTFLFSFQFSLFFLSFIVIYSAIEKKSEKSEGKGNRKGRIHHSNVNCDTKKARNVCSAIFSKAFALAVCKSFLYFIFE